MGQLRLGTGRQVASTLHHSFSLGNLTGSCHTKERTW
jgi:hypothetical protein